MQTKWSGSIYIKLKWWLQLSWDSNGEMRWGRVIKEFSFVNIGWTSQDHISVLPVSLENIMLTRKLICREGVALVESQVPSQRWFHTMRMVWMVDGFIPSLHHRERHWRKMETYNVCAPTMACLSFCLSIISPLPFVMFVSTHTHSFFQLPTIFKSYMFIFLSPRWVLPTYSKLMCSFFFLFAFISWNGNFVHGIFLAWKGEAKKL